MEDTIASIATPRGIGGIAIIRVSGNRSIEIVEKIFNGPSLLKAESHTIHYGNIEDPETGNFIDEVLVMVMRAPCTYTSEDIVEINCHGGPLPYQRVLETVLSSGARLAEPGEYTKRAFLYGRIDLAQAEAVMETISAESERGLEIALKHLKGDVSGKIADIREELIDMLASMEASIDYPDDVDDIDLSIIEKRVQVVKDKVKELIETFKTGKVLRDGLIVAIIGRPNVGKSSLLNALLKEERAIVTDVPGTTRDIITETFNLDGISLKLHDTAGLRDTGELVEQLGVERTLKVLKEADIIIYCIDGSVELSETDKCFVKDLKGQETIVVINKIDLLQKLDEKEIDSGMRVIKTSIKKEIGLDKLTDALKDIIFTNTKFTSNDILITNLRHKELLERACVRLERAIEGSRASGFYDLVTLDLRGALEILGEITGETVSEDVIDRIFRDYCLGK